MIPAPKKINSIHDAEEVISSWSSLYCFHFPRSVIKAAAWRLWEFCGGPGRTVEEAEDFRGRCFDLRRALGGP